MSLSSGFKQYHYDQQSYQPAVFIQFRNARTLQLKCSWLQHSLRRPHWYFRKRRNSHFNGRANHSGANSRLCRYSYPYCYLEPRSHIVQYKFTYYHCQPNHYNYIYPNSYCQWLYEPRSSYRYYSIRTYRKCKLDFYLRWTSSYVNGNTKCGRLNLPLEPRWANFEHNHCQPNKYHKLQRCIYTQWLFIGQFLRHCNRSAQPDGECCARYLLSRHNCHAKRYRKSNWRHIQLVSRWTKHQQYHSKSCCDYHLRRKLHSSRLPCRNRNRHCDFSKYIRLGQYPMARYLNNLRGSITLYFWSSF